MIQKLTLRQREYHKGSPTIRTVQLGAPGHEGEIVFGDNPDVSQLVQLDIVVGADTHRVAIHLPTDFSNKITTITWHKL